MGQAKAIQDGLAAYDLSLAQFRKTHCYIEAFLGVTA